MAHHEGLGKCGVGIKAPDSHGLSFCHTCHLQRHQQGCDTFWGERDPKYYIAFYLRRYLEETQNVDADMLIIGFLTEQIK